MRALTNTLLNLFFPPTCLGCERALNIASDYAALCPQCFKGISVGRLKEGDTMGGAAPYANETVRRLIHALKFQGVRTAAVPLGALLATYIEQSGIAGRAYAQRAYLLPVPLGARRLRTRGFDQAALIAKEASRRTALPVLPLLQRVRETAAQTTMRSAAARAQNLAGCFTLRGTMPHPSATLVLIDDVITSGATVAEAARAVRAHHRGPIFCLAAAQA